MSPGQTAENHPDGEPVAGPPLVIHTEAGEIEVRRFGWTPSPRMAELAARSHPDERLSPDAARLIFKGRPKNTRETYSRMWWPVGMWCGETGRDHMPMTKETVIEWMNECWRRPGRYGRPTAPKTVRLYLDVIAVAHRLAKRPEVDSLGRSLYGYESPTHHPDVIAAMKGYTQQWLEAGHRPDTSYPLSPDELNAMVATLDTRSPMGLCDAALLAIGYDMGARRVELSAINLGDVELHIAEEEVTEEDFLVVHVPMSKTDQSGEGDTVVLYAHDAWDAVACPVRLARAWIARMAEAGFTTGPLFRVVAHGGKAPADGRPKRGKIMDKRIGGERVADVVAATAAAAGLLEGPGRPKHIVPHSLRSGSATAAGEYADAPELNAHYRWSQDSTTGNKYVRAGRKKSRNPIRKVWHGRRQRPATEPK